MPRKTASMLLPASIKSDLFTHYAHIQDVTNTHLGWRRTLYDHWAVRISYDLEWQREAVGITLRALGPRRREAVQVLVTRAIEVAKKGKGSIGGWGERGRGGSANTSGGWWVESATAETGAVETGNARAVTEGMEAEGMEAGYEMPGISELDHRHTVPKKPAPRKQAPPKQTTVTGQRPPQRANGGTTKREEANPPADSEDYPSQVPGPSSPVERVELSHATPELRHIKVLEVIQKYNSQGPSRSASPASTQHFKSLNDTQADADLLRRVWELETNISHLQVLTETTTRENAALRWRLRGSEFNVAKLELQQENYKKQVSQLDKEMVEVKRELGIVKAEKRVLKAEVGVVGVERDRLKEDCEKVGKERDVLVEVVQGVLKNVKV
jgi:hypothetical protein